MAVHGGYDTDNQYIKYSIEIVQGAQNVANNMTSVQVKVRVYRTNTGYTTSGSGTITCTIDGTKYTSSMSGDVTNGTASTGTVFFNKTLNIVHNSDGTKTLTVSASISHSRFSASTHSCSENLTRIARASTLSFPSSVKLGSTVKFTINRQATTFTHKLYYRWNGGSWTLFQTVGASSDTYTWTMPASIAGTFTATTGKMYIKLETYSGSTLVGSVDTYNFTITVPLTTLTLGSSSVNVGSDIKVTFKKAASGLTSKLYYRWNSTTSTWTGLTSTTAASYTWTVPTSFGNSIPNAVSGTCYLLVETYSGNTKMGTGQQSSFKVNVPNTYKPNNPSITSIVEGDAKVAALNLGVFLKGRSKLSFNITGSGKLGATITSRTVSVDGQTYTQAGEAFTTKIITSNQVKISASLKDSRGYSSGTASSQNINFVTYTAPTITLMSVVRNSSTPSTLVVSFKSKGSDTSIIPSNTAKYYIAYKTTSANTWSSDVQLTAYNNNFNVNNGTYNITGTNTDTNYEIRLKYVDKVTTAQMITRVGGNPRLFAVAPEGKGITFGSEVSTQDGGKFSENAFVISPDWRFYIDGKQFLPDGFVIYAGSDAGSNETIILTESAANFTYLTIFFASSNGDRSSVWVHNPNGKLVMLSLIVSTDATHTNIRRTRYTISGTSITPSTNSAGYCVLSSSGVSHSSSGVNDLYITRVIGWR